ncbi:hypothetical protein NQZ68_004412 [Dissostichus eleginoides]|nr:hypothetical protein NQZ68_004412 [Dissostichus eleginoides]
MSSDNGSQNGWEKINKLRGVERLRERGGGMLLLLPRVSERQRVSLGNYGVGVFLRGHDLVPLGNSECITGNVEVRRIRSQIDRKEGSKQPMEHLVDLYR